MKLPEIYIEEMKSTGAAAGCFLCRAPTEKSLCPSHLRIARNKFRDWSRRRQRRGLCILCDKVGDVVHYAVTGRARRGLRCAFHRGINAERSRRWAKENGRATYAERKASGLCAAAPGHGNAEPGHVYCADCRRRHRAWQRSRR